MHELLIGQRDFYENLFAALRIPYEPIRWAPTSRSTSRDAIDKTARVQELINSFRVRGHLMADIDPLEYVQRSHPDLDIASHGLTFWDLDREFVTGGFGEKRTALLRDILGVLRDSYCRTIGIEYMHIQDPVQRKWIQDEVERKYEKPTHDEQMRILGKLNEAEAFETFLQTKYVGQKRFSLEGGESVIPLLDEILQGAAKEGLDEVAIGMAHRGRLNVLTNIAGKTYGQVFREFEGTQDPKSFSGSGDVKYHLGTEGTFTADDGHQIPVSLAANPSHLEAVDGVLEGIVRAKQDRKPIGTFSTLPILIHGDAAMAGQGVVLETMQMSQLRGYRTGGTIHVVVNNQVGFTTVPGDARSSIYSTDVAKTIQAPIFHVNGDDPEAVVRVAELAFRYRQEFKRDVVIDLVCYRRRGHNEGDDPSMTQPLMYNLIEAKRSVRKLYTEALVGRGDITEEEYEDAHRDFQDRLERAFAETHAAQTGPIPIIGATERSAEDERPSPASSRPPGVIDARSCTLIGDAFDNKPAGFTVHPKLQQLLDEAPRHEPQREHRLGLRRAARLRLAAARGHARAPRRAGLPPRHLRAAPRGAPRPDQRPGVAAARQPLRQPGQLLDLRLAALRVRGDGFEYGYSVERPDALVPGRPSSATSPTAPRPSSTSSSRRPSRSGASVRASCCCSPTATRARDPTTRRPHRAVPAAVRRGQHDGRAPSTPARTSTCCAARPTPARGRPLIVFTPKKKRNHHHKERSARYFSIS